MKVAGRKHEGGKARPRVVAVPDVERAIAALASRLPAGATVHVGGPVADKVARALEVAGLRAMRSLPASAACILNASGAGPVVEVFAGLAEKLPEGALVVASDVVWTTAPTPALVAAFPGARPMEGYEMQVEEAGFRILDKWDADRAAWKRASTSTQRAAIEADERGAAAWRTWLLGREP